MKIIDIPSTKILLATFMLIGCAPLPAEDCQQESQCAEASVDEVAEEPATDATIEPEELNSADESSPEDTTEDQPDSEDSTPSQCEILEGTTIKSEQLPLVLDMPLSMTSWDGQDPVAVDLDGTMQDGDALRWHFDQPLDTEIFVQVQAESLSEQWFAADYPEATFAAGIPGNHELVGLYQRNDDGILLLGIASRDDTPSTLTQITYDPPVVVMAFPLSLGDEYETTSSASGFFDGIPFYFASDHYQMSVDAVGSVVTPVGEYPVLRIYSERTFTLPVAFYPFEVTTHHKQFSFIAPCLGEIVHVTSAENEPEIEFANASVLERIALPSSCTGEAGEL